MAEYFVEQASHAIDGCIITAQGLHRQALGVACRFSHRVASGLGCPVALRIGTRSTGPE
jgi:hypothetical protein